MQCVAFGQSRAPSLFRRDLFIPDHEHRMAEVAADDAHALFQLQRQVGGAAAQIERERVGARKRVFQLPTVKRRQSLSTLTESRWLSLS